MAALRGKCLSCAVCWESCNDRRDQPHAAGVVVRCAVPMVSPWEGCKVKTPAATAVTTSAQNSLDSKPGTLPKRKNTVIAEALASLLDGAHLTGMDAVFDAHTTRLSHHIYALRHDYGWHAIQSRDLVVGTKDGRVETISVYSLPPEVIAKAISEGAMSWAAARL